MIDFDENDVFYVDINITAVIFVYLWHCCWRFSLLCRYQNNCCRWCLLLTLWLIVYLTSALRTSIASARAENVHKSREQRAHTRPTRALGDIPSQWERAVVLFRNSWEDLGSSEQSLELDILGGRTRRRRRKDGANWKRGKHSLIFFFWKQENEGFESSEWRRFQTNNLFFASDSPQTDIKGLHFKTLPFFWTSQ